MPDLIPAGVTLRPGTHDAAIWAAVFDQNEYRLPADMSGQVVLDIGCHTGSFAAACKSRGAAEVWGVEADAGNLALALHNVHATPGDMPFQAFHAAAWRSDRRGDRLRFLRTDAENTGCGRVLPDGETEVPSIQLDTLIKAATDHGRRRLDWLKIDCEGAEWPILFTSRGLHLVDNIAGEYHAGVIPDLPEAAKTAGVEYSIDALAALLAAAGFAVEFLPPNFDWFNLFFGRRVRFGGPQSIARRP
jgi:FkbM family methyltransferase